MLKGKLGFQNCEQIDKLVHNTSYCRVRTASELRGRGSDDGT